MVLEAEQGLAGWQRRCGAPRPLLRRGCCSPAPKGGFISNLAQNALGDTMSTRDNLSDVYNNSHDDLPERKL